MNKQTEALKMAIEALEDLEPDWECPHGYHHNQCPHNSCDCIENKYWEAIQACKEALEQPAQEPVAWECFSDPAYYDMWAIRQIGNRNFEETIHVVDGKEAKQLCAWLNSLNPHPAPSWQGLSDDEINYASYGNTQSDGFCDGAKWANNKLKDKNT